MATDINHDASAGVRTYRGRTVDELIPQIRGELGADAIILREREGTVGGVGGFFAQSFVEVDARRGDGGSIDIYDDLPQADLRLQPRPFAPPVIEREPAPAPKTPKPPAFETGLFMQRLREASAILPDEDDDVLAPPPPAPPAPEPLLQAEPAPEAVVAASTADPGPVAAPPAATTNAPEPVAIPVGPAEPATAARLRATPLPDSVRMPAPRPPQRPQPQPWRQPEPLTNPYASVRPRAAAAAGSTELRSVRNAPPRVRTPVPGRAAPRPGKPRPLTSRSPRPARPQASLLTTALAKFGVHGGSTTTGSRLSLPSPETTAAAQAIAAGLSARGASAEFAAELISSAGVHSTVFSSDLREGVATELASRIKTAALLPMTGAALAFVGAGGSGKSSCAAALASAYRRGSTMPVTVIAVDSPDGGQGLKRRLAGQDIHIQALSGARAKREIAAAHDGGIVIVDAPAAPPTDAAAVERLGVTLTSLELDAVYLTLPATLGPQAACRALAGYATLKPAAVAITHADETDQLAVVVETAISDGVALAYLHSGTDHRNALSPIDPRTVARDLLR